MVKENIIIIPKAKIGSFPSHTLRKGLLYYSIKD